MYQRGSQWKDFREIYIGTFMKICEQNTNMVETGQIIRPLAWRPKFFFCCRRHRFAKKNLAILIITISFTVIYISAIYTERVLAFPFPKWLCERASVTFHYVPCLVVCLPSISPSFKWSLIFKFSNKLCVHLSWGPRVLRGFVSLCIIYEQWNSLWYKIYG
jgi:hypothetical protein